mmetsp:Transcript_39795/g.82750  ORF Transcript_39795/g.82750 Transcript_39795/m.82750 type:complete len:211 (-) Transcript_39795:1048-1680(-)
MGQLQSRVGAIPRRGGRVALGPSCGATGKVKGLGFAEQLGGGRGRHGVDGRGSGCGAGFVGFGRFAGGFTGCLFTFGRGGGSRIILPGRTLDETQEGVQSTIQSRELIHFHHHTRIASQSLEVRGIGRNRLGNDHRNDGNTRSLGSIGFGSGKNLVLRFGTAIAATAASSGCTIGDQDHHLAFVRRGVQTRMAVRDGITGDGPSTCVSEA